MKLRPLKCFCELFPNYVQGRTKIHRLFLPYDPKIKEVIPDIDVASQFSTWSSLIIIQFDGHRIILIYYVVLDLVYLLPRKYRF